MIPNLTPNLFIITLPADAKGDLNPPMYVGSHWDEAIEAINTDAMEGFGTDEFEIEVDDADPVLSLHPGMDTSIGWKVVATRTDENESHPTQRLEYRVTGFEADWLPEGDNALGGR